MSAHPSSIHNASPSVRTSNEDSLNNGASAFHNRGAEETKGAIVIINSHSIVLDCLAQAIRLQLPQPVLCVPSIDQVMLGGKSTRASLIVLCQLGLSRSEVIRQVEDLSDHVKDCPAVVLSDKEDPDLIVEVLGKSIRGYIPTSLSLDVAIQAMQLVQAGGVFVPASSLIAAQRTPRETTANQYGNGIFTARQTAVVDALRRGKANKIIAYELNMKESTVKVHVRNIMKKLRATNRTQVAYIANRLINGEEIAN